MATIPVYTYRCGEKLPLVKNPHQFVIRALPQELDNLGWSEMEQVSSASTRVTVAGDRLESTMSMCRGIAPTHHAYQLQSTGEELLLTDRIFCRFKRSPRQSTLNNFIVKYSLVLKARYSSKEFLFQLTDYSGMNPVKLVVLLSEKETLIESAGHDVNRLIKKYQPPVPTDPSYLQQWHLHNRLNDPDFDPRSTSRCEEAWALLGNYGSSEVVIAISDDGCRLDHDDFNSAGKFATWGYFQGQTLITKSDINAQPVSMYQAGSNHGTSCAGVTAGEADAVKTVGAAPDCRLLPIKWESSGPSLFISDSKLITALDFIADKADVMSNSWGSSPTGVWENEVLNKINSLSTAGGRRGKGIVFLWAAGNENCPIEYTANVDIPYTHGVENIQGTLYWVGVETSRVFRHNLADLPGVMHIAALASTAQRSHYSNYGPGISLCAPTSNSHTYYRMVLDGLGITTAIGQGTGITPSFGGTSSATPLVAGVACLVISANPQLNASEVIAILKQTASKNLNMAGYPQTPPANFDSDTSWDVSPVAPFADGAFYDGGLAEGTWSPWFGHGKVDAVEAVREAIARSGGDAEDLFEGSSEPEEEIPDNQLAGISDTIHCPETGILKSIKIEVDLSHTYIGDLVLSIESPGGIEVVLHNRTGGPADDIKKTYDLSNSAGLTQLVGKAVNGDWTISVKDRAGFDTGTLHRWDLRIEMDSIQESEYEEHSNTPIPDNTLGGIERTLLVQESGTLQKIEVELDITHSFIGDLTVLLTSPSNTAVFLHNRSGGYLDNIIKTFKSADTPALDGFTGQEIAGDWKLTVADHANWDTGKLNYWRLKIEFE